MSQNAACIPHIIDQHAEEAAFLWLLRDSAVAEPHYSLKDLATLDNRIEANLDGLRIADDAGWQACLRNLEIGEPGELFAASVLAFERGEGKGIDRVVSAAGATPENFRALVSALGWIDYSRIEGLLGRLLAANSAAYRRIGIAACAVHRRDPGQVLEQAIEASYPPQAARALKAVGELKRRDLLPLLAKQLRSPDPACRFRAAWSAVLLGERLQAIEVLKGFAVTQSRFCEPALQLVLRSLGVQQAQLWLKQQAQHADWFRFLVISAGITGNPAYIPWLIKQMEKPLFARVAGEAFSMITGVDLAYEDLEGEWPEEFEAGPGEDSQDEDVAMDEDEDLPWPAPRLIAAWWQAHQGMFQAGTRYLVGRPITAGHCRQLLVTGLQRQRRAAALELALMDPAAPLFEVRAPGFVQQRLLGV